MLVRGASPAAFSADQIAGHDDPFKSTKRGDSTNSFLPNQVLGRFQSDMQRHGCCFWILLIYFKNMFTAGGANS